MRPTSWMAVGLPLVALLHLALLTAALGPDGRRPRGDENTYRAAAAQVARDEVRSPDLMLWPPLYPHLLARALALSGGRPGLVYLVQTALLAAAALVLRDLVRRLLGSLWAADAAALLLLGFPSLVAYAHALYPEVLHLALAIGIAWILVARPGRRGWAAVLGGLLGLALLAKSLLGPFVPAILAAVAIGAWKTREAGRRPGRAALAAALPAVVAASVAAALVVPVQVANYRVYGLFAVADNAWFNVWVGLSGSGRLEPLDPTARREYDAWRASAPDLPGRDAILRAKVRERLASEGPCALLASQASRQYFRLFDRDDLLTAQLPGGEIARRGFGYRKVPPAVAAAARFAAWTLYALLLVTAAWGAVLCRPAAAGRWAWLPLAFLGYQLALFLVVHTNPRFRAQLLPVFIVWAAAALDRLRRHLRPAPGEIPPAPLPGRWQATAAALAALALFLAFAGPWLDRGLNPAAPEARPLSAPPDAPE